MSDNKRKCLVICLLALFLGLIGIVLPEQENIAFELVVNNTNLAPTIDADHPGTGERVNNITYYANNSAIQIMVFAHASSISHTATVALYINDTLVLPQSGRPLAGAEEANRSVSTIIPKGASYRVNFTNYHHYEWREYPILSGRNGTLSINQTNLINQTVTGCTGDCAFNNLTVNSLGKNNTSDAYNLFIHLRSPFKSKSSDLNSISSLDLADGNNFEVLTSNISTGYSGSMYLDPSFFTLAVGNGTLSSLYIYHDRFELKPNGSDYLFNKTNFDMGGANITNCGNCVTDLNTKVNKTGDIMTGNLNVYANISTNGTGVFTVNKSTAFTGAGTTLLEFGRTSHESKFRATLNDLNGAYNFRTNVKDDGTQDNITGAGYSLAFQPWTSQDKVFFARIIPGTTTSENLAIWYRNDSMSYGAISGSDPSNFTVYRNGSIKSNDLSGGAGTVYVDDNGIFHKVTAPTGSGNVYICWNKSTKQPFYGTPGC